MPSSGRRPKNPEPGSLLYDLTSAQRQATWRSCCQLTGGHRFDCPDAEREARGAGPFLPTKERP